MMIDGQMAFAEGLARRSGSSAQPMELSAGGFRLPVPEHLASRLSAFVGQHVVLGIRPEHFHVRPPAAGPSAALEMKVSVVEPLGNDMDVYMSTNLHDHVVARVEADGGLRTETQVTLHVDLRKVHFFGSSPETGMNLNLSNEPSHAVA